MKKLYTTSANRNKGVDKSQGSKQKPFVACLHLFNITCPIIKAIQKRRKKNKPERICSLWYVRIIFHKFLANPHSHKVSYSCILIWVLDNTRDPRTVSFPTIFFFLSSHFLRAILYYLALLCMLRRAANLLALNLKS